jgi:DNA-binding HxlR family transcriptional regulator
MKEGTTKFYTYQKESVRQHEHVSRREKARVAGHVNSQGRAAPAGLAQFTDEQIAAARKYAADLSPAPSELDPRIGALVNDLIGRVADKWTMLILEVLTDQGELRFTRIGEAVPGISQKMLTQTLRQMERDGLLIRTVFPVVPPRVEYRLSATGLSLGAAFCGVWIWAADHLSQVEQSRAAFDARVATS